MKGTPMSDDQRVDVEPAAVLLGTLTELRATRPDAWTEGTRTDLALRLDRVQTLLDHLNEVRGWLELALAESMETDDEVIPGIGGLHRTEERRWTWRGPHSNEQMRDDLAVAVATKVAVDVGTGELDPIKRNVALHAIRTAYEAIPSFSTLKVGGQRQLGLAIGDYRTYDTYYRVRLDVGEGS
jgi:hypothetical protein